jgi:hypothetical protein
MGCRKGAVIAVNNKPVPEMTDSSCSEQAREIVGECPSLGFQHVAIVECAKRLAAEAERDALREALKTISAWEDFPPTGRKWDDGDPMSYGAVNGTSGERDYMRGIADAALAKSDGVQV